MGSIEKRTQSLCGFKTVSAGSSQILEAKEIMVSLKSFKRIFSFFSNKLPKIIEDQFTFCKSLIHQSAFTVYKNS